MIYADLELVSAGDMELSRKGYIKKEEIKKERVEALVDSGATMLGLSRDIIDKLGLKKNSHKKS